MKKKLQFKLFGHLFTFSIVQVDREHIEKIVDELFNRTKLHGVKKMKEFYHISLKEAKERTDKICTINYDDLSDPNYEYHMTREKAVDYLYETLAEYDRKKEGE